MRQVALGLGLLLASATAHAQVARFDWFDYRGADLVDAVAKADDARYRNPILNGFYPDPSLVRVGDDFYLVNSTFSYFPAIPIFHSRDLVSWRQIGNAIDRAGQLDFKRLGLSRGIFAPSIHWHEGTFYLACTCVDCGGNFVLTAKSAAGPWSDPHWIDVEGIDPSLFFDEDGSVWLLNNGPPIGVPRYDGHRAIWIQRFDLASMKPVGPRTVLIDGGVNPAEKPIWAEGPHIFRKDGFYYLITAEGGTAENHSQVVWRSKNVTGPYQPGPRNPILTQRDLDPARSMPITSAGHADFVETAAGEWWATFLATRPYRDDHYNLGRETFLLPVTWREGWPEMLPPGQPIPWLQFRPRLPRSPAPAVPTSGAFSIREEFDGTALPPHWLRVRATEAPWLAIAKGHLALTARPVALGGDGHPSYVGRRLQHHWASIETSVAFAPKRKGDRAGITAFQNENYFYALSLGLGASGTVVQLERRSGATDPTDGRLVAATPIRLRPSQPVALRMVARGDRYDFFWSTVPGEWQLLAKDQDGTILSTKTAGGFVGVTVGPFARSAD
jgi:alpha-N-arabinofuranosidase